jgi:orotidine-5'-phosphate decarboxylase
MAGQINIVNSIEKYNARVEKIDSLLCVGLDGSLNRLAERFKQEEYPLFAFNKWIIEETNRFAAAYKPNIAFYEARGEVGLRELKMTVDYLRENHPDILTICDAKRADIGNTSEAYAKAIFDDLGFDSVTLQPYLGRDALLPFLEREEKACIILCRTSNEGAGEFQDLMVGKKRLWQVVAETVAKDWNRAGNCMLVMGATYPNEMRIVREIVGEMTLLVPGIGVQGGNVEQTVTSGLNSSNRGLIINGSRGIIFAEDPAKAARELRDAINEFR